MIQLEEPSLVLTLDPAEIKLVKEMYDQLATAVPEAKIMLQTYFEALSAYEALSTLPVQGFGLDFVHGYKGNMASLRQFGFPQDKVLGIGVVNGRDIWRSNLAEVNATIQAIEQLSHPLNYGFNHQVTYSTFQSQPLLKMNLTLF